MRGPTDAILLGAGAGTRYSPSASLDKGLPKQFHIMEGKPVFVWALNTLVRAVPVRNIWVVVSEEYLDLTHKLVQQFLSPEILERVKVILGGPKRQDSSFNALRAIAKISPLPTQVLIHDACRPFISPELGKNLFAYLGKNDKKGWIPVVPVTETLKKVENQCVQNTVDRTQLFRVQTPQIFCFKTLEHYFSLSQKEKNLCFTDDASVLEHFGESVGAFPGDERNIKLTYEHDFDLIRTHLAQLKGESPCVSAAVSTSTV